MKMELFLRIAPAYLLLVNAVSALVFVLDKLLSRSKDGARRVPELILHLLELSGGVVAILPMIYIIRHKNRKFSYYVFTWLIFVGWAALWLGILSGLVNLS